MTRIVPFLAAASTAAFLAFAGAGAFAATTVGGHPSAPPSGPSGPSAPSGPTGGKASGPMIYGCDYQTDKTGLDGGQQRTFIGRCLQGGAS